MKNRHSSSRLLVVTICIAVSLFTYFGQSLAQRHNITIHNREPLKVLHIGKTEFNGGYSSGDILNNHYFPGILYYRHGNYEKSKSELDYFINRPHYTQMNPRQAEFFSTAHYLRGRIYFYHASGSGRQLLAKDDFEKSIQWNPDNHLSYIELSRLWIDIGNREAGFSVLKRLLELNPEDKISQQAKSILNSRKKRTRR